MNKINGVYAVFRGKKCEKVVGTVFDIYEQIDEINMEYSIRILYDAEDRGRLLTKDEIEILTLAFAKQYFGDKLINLYRINDGNRLEICRNHEEEHRLLRERFKKYRGHI